MTKKIVKTEEIEKVKSNITNIKILRVTMLKESVRQKKDILIIDEDNKLINKITKITSYADDFGFIYGHKIYDKKNNDIIRVSYYNSKEHFQNGALMLLEILGMALQGNFKKQKIYNLKNIHSQIIIDVKTLREIKRLLKK